MNTHRKPDWLSLPNWRDTQELTRTALVAGLYIALTFLTLPFSFGAIQFRLAETLNFTALYNKRYVYGVTLGVFIVNIYQFGVIDMVVGSLSTLIFLWLSRWVGDILVAAVAQDRSQQVQTIIRYAVLTLVFSASMFTIALELMVIDGANNPFWPTYFTLFLSEFVMLIIGSVVMYFVSQRIDLDR